VQYTVYAVYAVYAVYGAPFHAAQSGTAVRQDWTHRPSPLGGRRWAAEPLG